MIRKQLYQNLLEGGKFLKFNAPAYKKKPNSAVKYDSQSKIAQKKVCIKSYSKISKIE